MCKYIHTYIHSLPIMQCTNWKQKNSVRWRREEKEEREKERERERERERALLALTVSRLMVLCGPPLWSSLLYSSSLLP